MIWQDLHNLQHGDRVRETGPGGKEGAVECISAVYLRIRWEGDTYSEVDLENKILADFHARRWERLPERPAPVTRGLVGEGERKRKGRVRK